MTFAICNAFFLYDDASYYTKIRQLYSWSSKAQVQDIRISHWPWIRIVPNQSSGMSPPEHYELGIEFVSILAKATGKWSREEKDKHSKHVTACPVQPYVSCCCCCPCLRHFLSMMPSSIMSITSSLDPFLLSFRLLILKKSINIIKDY